MARPKVVIGDDSVVARMLIRRALQPLDPDLTEAVTGNGVIRALNAHKPQLVVLDISMPYPDGLTILRKMRADDEFRHTPVILCSVEGGLATRDEAMSLGAFAYLTKPTSPPALDTARQANESSKRARRRCRRPES
jgi:chemosensory pili system protein ChpA (sensor histidine kinase/response regulator)